jgi:glycosyltransferase involved in cell wall biosynthesis
VGKLDSEVEKSLLTIVVPVHNMAGRLTNLASWLETAHELNVNVILVHDKSTDATSIELEKLATSKNFPLHQIDVKSPGLARNAGLELVKTPWFSFADSDDLVFTANLLNLIKGADSLGCKIGIGSYVSNDLRSGVEILHSPPNVNEGSLPIHLANGLGLWRFVFKTKLFGGTRFTNHRMGEDYLFANLALNQTTKIYTSTQIVYKYFHNGKWNLTSNKSVMSDMCGVIECLKTFEPTTRIASEFKVFTIQKLILSVIKNLPTNVQVAKKFRLSIYLLSHPFYLVNLLRSIRVHRKSSKDA